METSINFALLLCSLSRVAIATIKLDQEHLSMYPYCGKLFGHAKHDGESRVVNSKDSEIQYPWVVLVMQEHMGVFEENGNTEEKMIIATCGGTVIGDK